MNAKFDLLVRGFVLTDFKPEFLNTCVTLFSNVYGSTQIFCRGCKQKNRIFKDAELNVF
jgi:hypothetical protein